MNIKYFFYILTAFTFLLSFNFAYQSCFLPSDFYQDYLASFALKEGLSIYANDVINLSKLIFGENALHDNFHPPFVAVFFYPISFIAYQNSALLMQCITYFLYFLLVYESLNYYKLSNKFYLVLPISFIWYPFIAHLGLVQISIFICYFLFKSYLFLEKQSIFKSAFLFALVSSIKLYPLYFFLYLFSIKKSKVIFYNILMLLGFMIVTVYFTGFIDFKLYFLERIKLNSFLSGEAPFNISLYSFLMYLFEKTKWSSPLIIFSEWKFIYYFFFIILSSPLLLNYKLKLKAYDLFPITCISMLILSPILWSHMLLILIPIFAYAYTGLKKNNMNKALLYFSILLTALPLMPINRLIISNYPQGEVLWYYAFILKLPLFSLFSLLIISYKLGINNRN